MSSWTGTTQEEVRRHNLAQLLSILHRVGPRSRSRLVTATGLNRSTVGVLVAELASAGLVRQVEGPRQGVGRPSPVVELVPESAVVLAFDVRVARTVAALVGLGGAVLERRSADHRAHTYDCEQAVREINGLAAELLDAAPADAHLVGMAVGVPGIVRHDDGMVRFAPNLGWVDAPFGVELSAASDAVVTVGNDADLGVLAEHVRGAAVDVANVLYLSGEVGVGGGVMLDGRLMAGAGGYGGEVGHMVVNPGGKPCRCGSRGCWETEIGLEAVLAATGCDPQVWAETGEVRPPAEEDSEGRAALSEIGGWLGLGLANLVNVFNPQLVIMGGTLAEILPLVADDVAEHLDCALPAARDQVRVTVPGLGGDSILMGAAETAFEALLADPLGALAGARRVAG